MNKNIYYNQLVNFLESLKSINIENSNVKILYNPNKIEDVEEIKFICTYNIKFNFSVWLWYNKYDFPRITLTLNFIVSEKNYYYEVLDEYDSDIESIIKYIKSILSNEFIFKIHYLNGKVIKMQYSYYVFFENKINFIENTIVERRIIFGWLKKRIKIEEYTYLPWINSEFSVESKNIK